MVTVSWVTTASSNTVESNTRLHRPDNTPVSATTARTASNTRSGASCSDVASPATKSTPSGGTPHRSTPNPPLLSNEYHNATARSLPDQTALPTPVTPTPSLPPTPVPTGDPDHRTNPRTTRRGTPAADAQPKTGKPTPLEPDHHTPTTYPTTADQNVQYPTSPQLSQKPTPKHRISQTPTTRINQQTPRQRVLGQGALLLQGGGGPHCHPCRSLWDPADFIQGP